MDTGDPSVLTQAVLRMLKGEEAAGLAKELGLPVEELEAWKDEFLAAGESAMTGAAADGDAKGPAGEGAGGDFSETSWFMAAVDLENSESDDGAENVEFQRQEYAPREDVTTEVRRAFSLRDSSELKSSDD